MCVLVADRERRWNQRRSGSSCAFSSRLSIDLCGRRGVGAGDWLEGALSRTAGVWIDVYGVKQRGFHLRSRGLDDLCVWNAILALLRSHLGVGDELFGKRIFLGAFWSIFKCDRLGNDFFFSGWFSGVHCGAPSPCLWDERVGSGRISWRILSFQHLVTQRFCLMCFGDQSQVRSTSWAIWSAQYRPHSDGLAVEFGEVFIEEFVGGIGVAAFGFGFTATRGKAHDDTSLVHLQHVDGLVLLRVLCHDLQWMEVYCVTVKGERK